MMTQACAGSSDAPCGTELRWFADLSFVSYSDFAATKNGGYLKLERHLLEFVAPLYRTLKGAKSQALDRLNEQRMLAKVGFRPGTKATSFELAA